VDIQSANALDPNLSADYYAPAGAGRATPAAPAAPGSPGDETDGEQAAVDAEPAGAGALVPAMYGSNARPVAARMLTSSISLIA
jgi:hypothetical protein